VPERRKHQSKAKTANEMCHLQPSDWKRLVMPVVVVGRKMAVSFATGRLAETLCRGILRECIKAFKKMTGFDPALLLCRIPFKGTI
jgi:hypothetical protein